MKITTLVTINSTSQWVAHFDVCDYSVSMTIYPRTVLTTNALVLCKIYHYSLETGKRHGKTEFVVDWDE